MIKLFLPIKEQPQRKFFVAVFFIIAATMLSTSILLFSKMMPASNERNHTRLSFGQPRIYFAFLFTKNAKCGILKGK